MLEVKGVNLYYGRTQVLSDVGFNLNKGEVLGFLGPNGAGKTSAIRIMTGFTVPSSGQVLFQGEDVRQNPMYVRSNLGYLPENAPVYPELKVREYLEWASRVKRIGSVVSEADRVCRECGLEEVQGKTIGKLSKGYRQRVGLAQAMLGDPDLLILDEPTIGLDPGQIREIREVIRRLGERKTVLLSTHILPEVELICDRVIIIDQGRILANDSLEDLVGSAGEGKYSMEASFPGKTEEEIYTIFDSIPEINSLRVEEDPQEQNMDIYCQAREDIRSKLTATVFESGGHLFKFVPENPTLETAFINLVYKEEE